MKRNYFLIVFVFVLPLLLGGCKEKEQQINPVKATTSQIKKQENITNNFMIMQIDNQGFPQSQGVFDYKKGVIKKLMRIFKRHFLIRILIKNLIQFIGGPSKIVKSLMTGTIFISIRVIIVSALIM